MPQLGFGPARMVKLGHSQKFLTYLVLLQNLVNLAEQYLVKVVKNTTKKFIKVEPEVLDVWSISLLLYII